MSASFELPLTQVSRERYGILAGRVRLLSWLSLAWMTVEGAVGAWWLDPVVGLLIAAVAVKEGADTWRGEGCCTC